MPFMYSWIALGNHKGLNFFFFFLSLSSCISKTRIPLFTHSLNEHLICARALC